MVKVVKVVEWSGFHHDGLPGSIAGKARPRLGTPDGAPMLKASTAPSLSGAGDLEPAPAASRAGDTPGRIGERIAFATSRAAPNRLANVIAPDLRQLGIAVVSVDRGSVRTELVDLTGGRGEVDADVAGPMEVLRKTVLAMIKERRHTRTRRLASAIARMWSPTAVG